MLAAVTAASRGLRAVVPRAANRWIHSTATVWSGDLESKFVAAKAAVQQVPSVDNMDKLQLYALYKQGKAKWDAWTKLGDMTKEEAQQVYIDTCQKLGADLDGTGSSAAAADSTPVATGQFRDITVDVSDKVYTITMNRPKKRNAITFEMYNEIQAALDEAAARDDVAVAVLTGSGEFYSSGNDLSNFANIPPEGPAALAEQAGDVLEAFVDKFITFPKVLVAAVNGPAVGIPVTTLPLCDIVYASHTATFHTPFTSLGQSPEACSSVTFPAIFGQTRANEMLLFGRKISAAESKEWGLVSEVFEASTFQEEVAKRVKAGAALFPNSLRLSKQLVRGHSVEQLQAANKTELELIKSRWVSDECMQAIMSFMNRRK